MAGFIVGLTGGIGSGKSAVSSRLEKQGITVVDADVVARQVVEPGTAALAAIEARFGPQILNEDGSLNRAALREQVFSDAEQKQWLEALLHPLIGAETEQQLQQADGPYVLFVSPLLVEAKQYRRCDRVVVVDLPTALQLTRTMQRDSCSQQQAEAIIAAQTSRDARLAVADYVVDNSGSPEQLEDQVAQLHQTLLQQASAALPEAVSRS